MVILVGNGGPRLGFWSGMGYGLRWGIAVYRPKWSMGGKGSKKRFFGTWYEGFSMEVAGRVSVKVGTFG